MNDRLWECPVCFRQFTTPGNVYQAICGCLMYSAQLYCNGPRASVTFEQTDMVDITPRHQPGDIVVVPDDMSEL